MKPFRHLMLSLAALGLLTGLAAGAAYAEDDPSEFVRMQIERTDLRIEQAETLVSAMDNDRAEMHLAAAVDLQGRAKENFANTNYEFALRLTTEARGHADRAIAIVRNLPDPERVKAQIERTQELLERARQRIEECDVDRARAMMSAAIEMQKRALDAARDGQYLVALQLTVNARERAMKALRLCNVEENLSEAAERQVQRTDNIISRAREALEGCDKEQARLAMSNAERLQEQAKTELRQENYRPALKLTQMARRAAYSALRLCDLTS